MPPIIKKKLSAFAMKKEKLATKKAKVAEREKSVRKINAVQPTSNVSEKVLSKKRRKKKKKIMEGTKVTDNNSSSCNSIVISDDDDDNDDVAVDSSDEDGKTACNRHEVKDNDVEIIETSDVILNPNANTTKGESSDKDNPVREKRKKSRPSNEKNLSKRSKPDKNVEDLVTPDETVEDGIVEDVREKLDIAAIPVSDNDVIVVAKHPMEFALKGYVQVQMLGGSIKIMEHELTPSSRSCDIFSLTNSSLIKVKTTRNLGKKKKWLYGLKMKMNKRTVTEIDKYMTMFELCVVMRFTKLKSNVCSFIRTFSQYTKIFNVESDNTEVNDALLPLNVTVVDESTRDQMLTVCKELEQLLDDWKLTLSQIHDVAPVILICGGKDSGKSTTIRLMMNTALNRLDRIYYLECDVGQTEFTPPGVVSLIEVTTPLFGPPFTHQQTPVCSYHFGGVSAIDNPDEYIHCVHLCMTEYNKLNTTVPLIVNCMGWMKGLGWQLLLDVIRITSPSHIVQLKAMMSSQNVDPITLDQLQDHSFTDLSQMYHGPTVSSKSLRESRIITMEETYAVRQVHMTDSDGHISPAHCADISKAEAYTENGPLILDRNESVPYKWIGYGVVRGIDMVNKKYYIVTSLNEKQLSRVTLLEKSGVAVPENFLTSQAEAYTENGPLILDRNESVPYRWIGYGVVRGIDMVNKKYYIVTSLNEKQLSRVTLLEKSGVAVPENFLTSQAEAYTENGPLILDRNESVPYRWIGYGVVRGIDMVNKKYYIVTSLNEKQLSRVTLLEKSGVAVPENFLTSQAEAYTENGPLILDRNESVPYRWIGYGVVRGIDMVNKKYYIVTSLNEKQLSRVTLLEKSGVAVPENFLTSQAEAYTENGPLILDRNESVPYRWIGYGVVRGIDMVNKKYYIVTSLNEKQLSRVTLLEKSGVAVPENFLTSQAEAYTENGPLILDRNESVPYRWIGYGVVRGIDMVNKKYYIVTSLNEKQLSRVTLLEKSGVAVPENFVTSQKCENMLYVDEVVSSIGLAAVRPRKHLPRKKLGH
ncbi:Polynucleotide 5'-hydroxyl-kinase nol9 [Mactra antiquata]